MLKRGQTQVAKAVETAGRQATDSNTSLKRGVNEIGAASALEAFKWGCGFIDLRLGIGEDESDEAATRFGVEANLGRGYPG